MPDQAHRETDKELEKMERKLRTVYGQAAARSQQKANGFFEKFAELDRIKKQQVKEGKLDQETYLTWRRNKMAMGENYRAMVDTLTSDMTNTNQIAASVINGHLPDVYANNYNFGTYQIEHDSQINTSFTLYDRQTVERLIRDNPDIIPIKARVDIPKDKLWNKQKINSVITQSILTGDSIPDIAKSLQKVAEMNKIAAVRTARTATTSAQNGGRVDSYRRAQEMGIKLRQQWMATLDGRTRDSHKALDGEIIAVAKDKWHPAKFSNGCRFPGDPQGPGHEIYNCRCTLLGVVDGVDFELSDVTQRDSKLGEQSYDEWKAGHKKKQAQKPVVEKPKEPPKSQYPIKHDTPIAQESINVMGEKAYDEMQSRVEMCENEDLKKVFYKTQDELSLGDGRYKGTAHCAVNTLRLNLNGTTENSHYRKQYSTYYHEASHGMDNRLARRYREKMLREGKNMLYTGHYSEVWENGKFSQTIKDEVNEWVDKVNKQLKAEFDQRKTDFEWLVKNKYLDFHQTFIVKRVAQTHNMSIEDVLSGKADTARQSFKAVYSKKQAYTAIAREINAMDTGDKNYWYSVGCLSDIVEGATKGKIQTQIGHGKTYWKRVDVSVEAFAEMSESYFATPESLEVLRKHLPKSVECFDDMMADAVKLINEIN